MAWEVPTGARKQDTVRQAAGLRTAGMIARLAGGCRTALDSTDRSHTGKRPIPTPDPEFRR